jgi:hypothetical protein
MGPMHKVIAIIVFACSTQACAYDRTEGRQLQVYWHEGRATWRESPYNIGVIGVALFRRKQEPQSIDRAG